MKNIYSNLKINIRGIKLVYILLITFTLSGCNPLTYFQAAEKMMPTFPDFMGGGKSAPKGPPVNVRKISIIAEKNANQDGAVAVELVLIYDASVAGEIMNMQAREYFQVSEQKKRDNPNIIKGYRWELTPGQSVINESVSLGGKKPFAAVIFADYITPGDHRIRIGTGEHLEVILKRGSFWAGPKI